MFGNRLKDGTTQKKENELVKILLICLISHEKMHNIIIQIVLEFRARQ